MTEVQEHPPSTLRNIDDEPPWEMVPEIREHPLSTIKNVNGGPPGRC
jgi:hypothetical protein